MEIKKEIQDLFEELIELRRDFHKHPELGFQEFRTSELIKKYLNECGLEVITMAKTGVVGLLRGENPGKTLLLRADMDALPIQEENDIDYKSIYDGKMHACGHDGHMAMLLVAAKILSRHKNKLNGNIKFVFQPNEEDAGAKYMVEEGVLENPHVDASMAIHLWSSIESGKIGISSGPVMAEHFNFKLILKGMGGHTSAPHSSIDPIICASNIIQTIQMIQTREVDALKPTLILFGKINGGSAPNIIPDTVELEGTIRCLYDGQDEGIEQPRVRFSRIVKGICEAYRIDYQLDFIPSNYLVNNDPEFSKFIVNVIEENMNYENKIIPYVCMGGEDFSEFCQDRPGTLVFVGTGNSAVGSNYPHHHSRFNIDENTLITGTEIHIRTALAYLK